MQNSHKKAVFYTRKYVINKNIIKLTEELLKRTNVIINYCSCNMLSNIPLLRSITYEDEITGDHQCVFKCNRSSNYSLGTLHSSHSGEKVREHWDGTSAISQLQQNI
jgi:hypothetical protein